MLKKSKVLYRQIQNEDKEQIERIKQHLYFLCSKEAFGRLSGTEGAKLSAKYLADEMRSLGLSPAGVNEYYGPVEVNAARLSGPVILKVNDLELNHRKDYDEYAAFSSGGEAYGRLVVVRDGEELEEDIFIDSIVLIPERPEGFSIGDTIDAAARLGVKAIVIEQGEPNWFYKSVYGSSSNKIPVLRIRKSAAQQLEQHNGELVYVKVPLEIGVRTCNNVLGVLPGRDTMNTLVLSAHYDHVGSDPDGEHFPGAFDNASGAAVLLAVARILKLSNVSLPFNILFTFLTGEESGLWGARHLVEKPPVRLSAVINLDSIGIEDDLYAIRIGHSRAVNNFVKMAADLIEGSGTRVQWITGSDDSMVFIKNDIPTIGLGQQSVASKTNNMHKPTDAVDELSMKPIVKMINIITTIIAGLANNPELLEKVIHDHKDILKPIKNGGEKMINLIKKLTGQKLTNETSNGCCGTNAGNVSSGCCGESASDCCGTMNEKSSKSGCCN